MQCKEPVVSLLGLLFRLFCSITLSEMMFALARLEEIGTIERH